MNNSIVTPSFQIESTLPGYISQNYQEFVKFMTKADESEERFGFSDNILQNLQRYRDFNNYRNRIVESNFLAANLSIDADEFTLEDGYGFPEENGIVYIHDEIIYYTTKVGNTFSGLQRGASGTVILPTFTDAGVYRITEAVAHNKGDEVKNISVLFLSSLLETIYDSYVPDISPSRVSPEINNATLLENIKDFYRSKGSKLSIKAIFKILFAENDVEVTYPGDRMITPSSSTWTEGTIMRVKMLPQTLTPYPSNILEPDRFVNQLLEIYNFNDWRDGKRVKIGSAVIDYATSYSYDGNIQYELLIQEGSENGQLPATPTTIVSSRVSEDTDVIDVESTLSFPYSGVIHIGNEAILYTEKTLNQFINCTRGYYGIKEAHPTGSEIFGDTFLTSSITIDNIEYQSFCWILGLVNRVSIVDGGRLHTINDDLNISQIGSVDPRYPVLASFIENPTDIHISQAIGTNAEFLQKYTTGIDSVYFDTRFAFAIGAGFPYYTIGKFSDDNSIGEDITIDFLAYAIPLHLTNNDKLTKGTNQIGVFIDSVPAYSQESPERYISGEIANIEVTSGGSGYSTIYPPTVLIDPPFSNARAVVNTAGQVSDIQITAAASPNVYTYNPTVRLTSGEGAVLSPVIDRWGRLQSVTVIDGGRFYKQAPEIKITDPRDIGKGGRLVATVAGGEITAVAVIDGGIDYSKDSVVSVLAQGSGATATATVQYYNYNRYQQVINNPDWYFDGGNGFLYEAIDDPQLPDVDANPRTTYGYVCNPVNISDGDSNTHSSIIGWAFDGNPIYGPYGYRNGRTPDAGVKRMQSGYAVMADRTFDYPNGYPPGVDPNTGSAPPPVNTTYPMGTFTQDFVYRDNRDVSDGDLILTDDPLEQVEIQTENGLSIATNGVLNPGPPTDLDENNGRICNTPDYPVENYPNGVYCYFVTIDENGAPAYPYIIGNNYQNQPIDWYLHYDKATGEAVKTAFGDLSFDPIRTYDTSTLIRYRSPNIENHNSVFDLQISGLSKGGVSSILVENGFPENTLVGDLLYYENPYNRVLNPAEDVVSSVDLLPAGQPAGTAFIVTETSDVYLSKGDGTWEDIGSVDGTGALGVVSWVNGENVVSSSGKRVESFLFSHRQILDLTGNATETDPVTNERINPFTFVKDTKIRTWNNAIARVRSYNQDAMLLELQTLTERLVEPNPSLAEDNVAFFDNIGNPVKLFAEVPSVELGTLQQGGLNTNRVIVSYHAPTIGINGLNPEPGDLAWSVFDGRLFVYYEDQDSAQWVVTQPLGTTPIGDNVSPVNEKESYASNDLLVDPNQVEPQEIIVPEGENKIFIAPNAPTVRTDGTALLSGDLWWSNQTGILSIWYIDSLLIDEDPLQETRQWVITDPAGIRPFAVSATKDYADFETWPNQFGNLVGEGFNLEADVRCIISGVAPTTQTDGTPLEYGNLFWSYLSGKMYVWWNDNDTDQWTVCNPSGSVNTQYSANVFPDGPVGPVDPSPTPLGQVGELPEQVRLFFDTLEDFIEGDKVLFRFGNAGVDEVEEDARLKLIGPNVESVGRFERGFEDEALLLPNGTTLINKERAIYTITTETPHYLITGDKVIISGSDFAEVNGEHTVIKAGNVTPAVVIPIVDDGKIKRVDVKEPGAGYQADFVISFFGGNGQGAFYRGIVAPANEGGGLLSTEQIAQGFGYTDISTLTPILGNQSSDREFSIYTKNVYGTETGDVSYITSSSIVESTAARVKVESAGSQYTEIPPALGLYKRQDDRAEFIINPTESQVDDFIANDSEWSDAENIFPNGTSITRIDVVQGGSRYSAPRVIILDRQKAGYGATATASVEDGVITGIDIVTAGADYREPYLVLVEEEGKYISVSNDIGVIRSIDILDAGKSNSIDTSLAPKIDITTNCILSNIIDLSGLPTDEFIIGSEAYQGSQDNKLVTATIAAYKHNIQQLTLNNVNGKILNGFRIYDAFGNSGIVKSEGDADCRAIFDGTAAPEGKFINEESMLSREYAVIQDSFKYQYFSYNIQSPLQRVQYDTFINKMVHPAGFIMFSELDVNLEVTSPSEAQEVVLLPSVS